MLLKKPLIKNILSVLAVSFFGFALWNTAFIVYAALVNLPMLFLPPDFARTSHWFMTLMLIVFFVLLVVLSWFVFRSSLPDLFKATYMTMPLVVALVSIGILTYPNPWLAYWLSASVVAVALTILIMTKRSWIYYYAILFTSITLLIFTLSGGEI